MRYVYNSNKRELRDLLYYNKAGGKPTHRPKHLSKREGKLLMLLSDRESHTYEEMCKFLYGLEVVTCRTVKGKKRIIDRKTAQNRIRVVASRMMRKIRTFEMQMIYRIDIGIKLVSKEEIWLE